MSSIHQAMLTAVLAKKPTEEWEQVALARMKENLEAGIDLTDTMVNQLAHLFSLYVTNQISKYESQQVWGRWKK